MIEEPRERVCLVQLPIHIKARSSGWDTLGIAWRTITFAQFVELVLFQPFHSFLEEDVKSKIDLYNNYKISFDEFYNYIDKLDESKESRDERLRNIGSLMTHIFNDAIQTQVNRQYSKHCPPGEYKVILFFSVDKQSLYAQFTVYNEDEQYLYDEKLYQLADKEIYLPF